MTIFTAETLSVYQSRCATNRGNGYLQPFAIGNPYSSSQAEIFPNHDCNNTFGGQQVLRVTERQARRPRAARRSPRAASSRLSSAVVAAHDPSFVAPELRGRRHYGASGRPVGLRGMHDRRRTSRRFSAEGRSPRSCRTIGAA